ncbi:MAG: AAA family ATPase [Pseudomonadota bacterium]
MQDGGRILAVANQKGGVGKTTTAVNLGAALASVGRRVLVVDLDPQGNATTNLGVLKNDVEKSSYWLLIGNTDLQSVISDTAIENLYVVPSSEELVGAEAELLDEDLVLKEKRRFMMRDALRGGAGQPFSGGFDYVLIDCPPSLNLLTVNAFAASDAIVVPLQCEFLALEGLKQLLQTINLIKKSVHPTLEVQGVVLTMFDRSVKLSGEVADDAREQLGYLVYDTLIPRNVKIAEAPSHGMPVLQYDPACSGSRSYIKLAAEFLQREQDPVL